MPKFYVQSGLVRLIFDAANAEQAAVMAFQWTCDQQAEIEAASPLNHVLAYRDVAEWYPLLTPDGDYAEEAALVERLEVLIDIPELVGMEMVANSDAASGAEQGVRAGCREDIWSRGR